MDKTLLIIPCYNEGKTIKRVIKGLQKLNFTFDILVIDDNSSDNTVEEIKNVGVNYLSLPINLGYNYDVQTGLKYGIKNGYETFILMDGDGQHLSEEVPIIIKEFKDSDIVIGSRFSKKYSSSYKIPFSRKMGMIFFSIITFIITGKKIKDTSSGFQIFNKKVAKALIYIYETKYPDAEVLVLLHLLGFKIKEIQVKMEERKEGSSMISGIYYPIRVSFGIILAIGRFLFLKKKVKND
jgi:glycosyltransferase involved in cell wall biosynthesis